MPGENPGIPKPKNPKEHMCIALVGYPHPNEKQKKLLAMFDNISAKMLDLGNLSNHLDKNDNGEDIFEFKYFTQVLKLVSFWKMMRLDNEPTPNDQGHFKIVRSIKRKALFGPNALAENKVVDS